MVSPAFIQAHLEDKVENLALCRSRYADLLDEDWRFFLQQVEGYQRTKDKLPTFAAGNWWYPPRLSCEQCSSEATARYKAKLTVDNAQCTMRHLIDLTGGAGVDTYFMSENFETVDYVEQNAELCALAQHNLPSKVTIHNTTAEEFLNRLPSADGIRTVHTPHSISEHSERSKRYFSTIYIDPARRDKNGGKVFRLEDCTPNVVELLPRMREVADTIMIKLSPMLDITAALRSLGDGWQVHVVAVKNEVKEVLLVTPPIPLSKGDVMIATDVAEGWQFEFTREEEENTMCPFTNLQTDSFTNCYLYEPGAAILKAGAYKLVGARYGLSKLDVNTHLYVSDQLIDDFPGRVFKVHNAQCTMHDVRGGQYNVLTRNYVMGAEELKKKLHVRDGGTQYIIGTRASGKPILLLADRVS
ncbi:MAG: hypothetical protein MJZ65_00080 [Paludibacteraceae bacterium]|nr:hypothetical protein [Paludibacteraceae bacterium]